MKGRENDFPDESMVIPSEVFKRDFPIPPDIKKRMVFWTPNSHRGNWVYDRFMERGNPAASVSEGE